MFAMPSLSEIQRVLVDLMVIIFHTVIVYFESMPTIPYVNIVPLYIKENLNRTELY